ncbi:OPT/YSL family transporter [Phocicoccus pinnipedialis]|uniref:OPT oligopeptide transporter protein n=1 Tax=Phocicoccus pinnipedialis TaxID=110845 RepID=A0A6V7R5D7_9BACL|nr:OPT/YSL family transporter [Jeotgalicoccus pinnipedialis]MBP1939661.1 putative oligopeptide transporter (OPT) family protein [Jeotgalicoccus pinnipedialis]CAD2072283.1 hypothetical protein JEOPIN946_00381 [Jeotgalicoccus pinnipedialis]
MNNTKKKSVFLDPIFMLIVLLLSVLGAIIGMQLITTLGITANTSIIGALFAMLIARVPITYLQKFRDINNQNLLQTAISAATFGAGNTLFIPIGIPFVLGMPELVTPMLIGAAIGLFIDGTLMYLLFGSKAFPASGAWPPGIATAEAIKAGDQGGKKAGLLGLGVLGGIAGSVAGIPMSAFGVAFIGNIVALTMFGIGLLLSSYSEALFSTDISAQYVPHGIMVGAGLVAFFQFIYILTKKDNKQTILSNEADEEYQRATSRKNKTVGLSLVFGYIAYIIGAILLAALGGILTDMSIWMIILFVTFAAFAALITEVIVGVAAMHSGWFPAFAVSLITLVIGIIIGFPVPALALLVGYTAATGPAFADLGYDFKTGYILRRKEPLEGELLGRQIQFMISLIGFGIAILMVALFHNGYFAQDLVPPVDYVFAATIEAGADKDVAIAIALWAIPGAILQLIGGPKRQMGILFATGLLLVNPMAGWAVLAGIIIRFTVIKIRGEEAQNTMYTVAAGFIAGDALYSFFNSMFKAK